MVTLSDLKNIHFVLDASGKQAAVQVSIEDWRKILEYLEEVEDRKAVKDMLGRLIFGPVKSGALDWDKARGQW